MVAFETIVDDAALLLQSEGPEATQL
jgi:hypothetical protein